MPQRRSSDARPISGAARSWHLAQSWQALAVAPASLGLSLSRSRWTEGVYARAPTLVNARLALGITMF